MYLILKDLSLHHPRPMSGNFLLSFIIASLNWVFGKHCRMGKNKQAGDFRQPSSKKNELRTCWRACSHPGAVSLFHQYVINSFAASRKHFFYVRAEAEIESNVTATLNYSLQYTCSKRPNDWQIPMNHNQTLTLL